MKGKDSLEVNVYIEYRIKLWQLSDMGPGISL